MKIITAEVITIGDEILIGQITDTNTQWISERLNELGIKVSRKTSVGDDREHILQVLKEASSRADIVITTGGLGPTKDDITKHTFCQYFNTTLILHEPTLAHVRGFFEKRGRELTEINRQQAFVPENCTVLFNEFGTAPGMWFEENDTVYISLPGVPFEMKNLMMEQVFPKLKKHFKTPAITHYNLMTFGIGESALAEKIAQWEDALPTHIKLAYLPSPGMVRLRLTGISDSKEAIEKELEHQIVLVKPLIEKYVYADGDVKLEDAIGRLLKNSNKTISTAESCTGGYAAHLLTSISGSSAYFQGSIVSYSNDIKIKQLNVKPETLAKYGAVSEETVKEMAENVRRVLNTDIGIASSGIAGPDGGTPDKPVGTIWIAYADGSKTVTKLLQLISTRENNIRVTALSMLDLVRRVVSSE